MADEMLGGALLGNSPLKAAFSENQSTLWTAEQEQLATDGPLIQTFLSSSSTQLSYAGLFQVSIWLCAVKAFNASSLLRIYRIKRWLLSTGTITFQ